MSDIYNKSFYDERIKEMPLIYVAGRFSDGGKLPLDEQKRNRDILRYHSAVFTNLGWAVISPLEMDLWACDRGLMKYEDCIGKDLVLISRSDMLFLAPGWEKGTGTRIEFEFAQEKGIPIIHDHMSAQEFLHGMWRRIDEVG